MYIKENYFEIASYAHPTLNANTQERSDTDAEDLCVYITKALATIYSSNRLLQENITPTYFDENHGGIYTDLYLHNYLTMEAKTALATFFGKDDLSIVDTIVVNEPTKGSFRYLQFEKIILCNHLKCNSCFYVADIGKAVGKYWIHN